MIAWRTNIISGSTGPPVAIFSPNVTILGANDSSASKMVTFGEMIEMIDLDLVFRYLKGYCHGNQFCGKMATNSPHMSLGLSEKEWDIEKSNKKH